MKARFDGAGIRATGQGLQKVAPGIYVDSLGIEYFYLPGIYPTMARALDQYRIPHTPALLLEIFGELRHGFERMYCIELMD